MNHESWLSTLAMGVCHQDPDRMLSPIGLLCARCTGIYLGLLIVTTAQLLSGRRMRQGFPQGWRLVAILAGGLPLLLDGGLSDWLYPGFTPVRWATGLLAGGTLGFLLAPLLNSLNPEALPEPLVHTWRQLLLFSLPLWLVFGLGFVPLRLVQEPLAGGALLGLLVLYLTLNAVLVGTLLRPRRGPAPADSSPVAHPRPGWWDVARLSIVISASALLAFAELWLLGLLKWVARP